MRVLHVQKSAGIGGSERHLLSLLPGLVTRGIHPRMVVLRARGGERFVDELRGQRIETVVVPAGPDVNPIVLVRLLREVRRFRAELVHTHLIHADLHGQLAARLARVPAISTLHGTHGFYCREPYRSVARLAGRMAARTIAISQHAVRFVREVHLAPPDRLRVVQYGIDAGAWAASTQSPERARAALGLDMSGFVVGIASRLIPFKGHDFLLKAVAAARQHDASITLVVAGEGQLRARLEARARVLLPEDSCRFLGFVTDIRTFMCACDVVAFPTLPDLNEGFGLAALEAMAAGRPVVATDVGPLPELVVDGATGLLVDPGDVDGLAAALRRLAVDPKLRSLLGARARARAATEFSIDAMVDRTLAVYKEVLAERRQPGVRIGA